MPSSIPGLKFLLDENVKKSLFKFLEVNGFDVKLHLKGVKDSVLANTSKQEERILITNDWDFEWYTKDQIYSVVILRTPQHDSKALISSFEKMLKEFKNFEGRIVLLEVNKWSDYSLWEEIK